MKVMYWIITVGVLVAGIVAGRMDFEAELAALPSTVSPAAGPEEADPEEAESSEAENGPADESSSGTRSGSSPDSARDLAEARKLFKQAQILYQKVQIHHELDARELQPAKEKLDRALELLSKQPADDLEAQKFKEEAQYLLAAVIKALPF
ncbi:MAG: hypothetical protein HY717_07160 [Planctomycetes bacterium]|nr:hypothetical protein [Planctomycetota bacterium]